MSRAKDPQLREDLLRRATGYVLRHGLADLSLRPLGEEIGTTARMLVYHFGSKEALVAAILERATAQQQDALRAPLGTSAGSGPADALRSLWRRLSHPDTRPLLHLLFEVEVLGLHEPTYAAFSQRAFASWCEAVAPLLPPRFDPDRARTVATLIVGTVSGLLLDLVVSGDAERVDAAFEMFLDALLEEEEDA